MPLEAGDNEILVHSEDLAERDTTWFFELEMLDKEPLSVLLPVALDHNEVRELEALSRGVRPARDVFVREPLEIIFDTRPSATCRWSSRCSDMVTSGRSSPMRN